MEIKIGSTYRTRNGETALVTGKNERFHAWIGHIGSNTCDVFWSEDGHISYMGENGGDLISECIIDSDTQYKRGTRWLTKDKSNVVTIMDYIGGAPYPFVGEFSHQKPKTGTWTNHGKFTPLGSGHDLIQQIIPSFGIWKTIGGSYAVVKQKIYEKSPCELIIPQERWIGNPIDDPNREIKWDKNGDVVGDLSALTLMERIGELPSVEVKTEQENQHLGRYFMKNGGIAIIERFIDKAIQPLFGRIFFNGDLGNKDLRWSINGKYLYNTECRLDLLYKISPKVGEVWKNVNGDECRIISGIYKGQLHVSTKYGVYAINKEDGTLVDGSRTEIISGYDLCERIKDVKKFKITGVGNYLTRDGRRARVDSYSKSPLFDKHYWEGHIENDEAICRSWSGNGQWGIEGDLEDGKDIVAKIDSKEGVRLVLTKKKVGRDLVQLIPSLQDMETGKTIEPETKSINLSASVDELPQIDMKFFIRDITIQEDKE